MYIHICILIIYIFFLITKNEINTEIIHARMNIEKKNPDPIQTNELDLKII